jgi:hypothetical protein
VGGGEAGGVAVGEPEPLPVAVPVAVSDGEPLLVPEGVHEGEGEGEGVRGAVGVALADPVCEPEGVAAPVGEPLSEEPVVAVKEGVAGGLGEGVGEGEGLEEPVAVGVALTGEGVAEDDAEHRGPEGHATIRILAASPTNSEQLPSGPSATETGAKKSEKMKLSVNLATPVPASRPTSPVATTTLRTRALPESATNSTPDASWMAEYCGCWKRAAVPWPFAKPGAPAGDPASVLSRPLGDSRRMQWLLESETNAQPLLFAAMPCGLRSIDAPGKPSASPGVRLPATMATTALPARSTRTAWLPQSVTNTLPAASSASAEGPENMALAAAPSAKPATPVPARALTAPPGDTSRSLLFSVSATKAQPDAFTARPAGALKTAAPPASVATPPPPSARSAFA